MPRLQGSAGVVEAPRPPGLRVGGFVRAAGNAHAGGWPGRGDGRNPVFCGVARCAATPGTRCSAGSPGPAGLPGSGGLMMARSRGCPEPGVLRVTWVGRCARLGGLRRGPDHQVTTVRGGRWDGLAPQVARLAGCERLGVVPGRSRERRHPSEGDPPLWGCGESSTSTSRPNCCGGVPLAECH